MLSKHMSNCNKKTNRVRCFHIIHVLKKKYSVIRDQMNPFQMVLTPKCLKC